MNVYCECGQKLDIIKEYPELDELIVETCWRCYDAAVDAGYEDYPTQQAIAQEIEAAIAAIKQVKP